MTKEQALVKINKVLTKYRKSLRSKMKTLISILIVALTGCASKPEPVEWCKIHEGDISDRRVPLRLSGCPSIKDGYTNQSHLRKFQQDVGIRTMRVEVKK